MKFLLLLIFAAPLFFATPSFAARGSYKCPALLNRIVPGYDGRGSDERGYYDAANPETESYNNIDPVTGLAPRGSTDYYGETNSYPGDSDSTGF